MSASATSTSRKPSTSVSGSRSAASTGGMTAFSAATIAATTSAPQKSSMLTPGRSPPATISATPVASHETRSGNSRQRGRSGCQRRGLAVGRLGCASHQVSVPPSSRAVRRSSAPLLAVTSPECVDRASARVGGRYRDVAASDRSSAVDLRPAVRESSTSAGTIRIASARAAAFPPAALMTAAASLPRCTATARAFESRPGPGR